MTCLKCADNDAEWSDEGFIPIAVIAYGGGAFGTGDEMFEDVFAYLFWDEATRKIVYATSDDWKRSNTINTIDELQLIVE